MTPPRKRGGQTQYTPELAADICERLSTGQSLREISRCSGMPSASTIAGWATNSTLFPEFGELYAHARGVWLTVLADEILEISDDASNDFMSRQHAGGEDERVLDAEHVQRSRLRVDSRKWLLSKLKPGVYGDKISQEISGPDGAAIPTRVEVVFVDPPKRILPGETKLIE